MGFYQEKQRLREPWVWVVLVISTLPVPIMFLYGIYQQLIVGKPWGNNPMSDSMLVIMTIVFTALIAGVYLLFISSELTTEIKDKGIYVKFIPFFTNYKRFGKEDIQEWLIIKYNTIATFRGFGIRYSLKHGKGYVMGGKYGLQLKLKNNKKLLISTKKPAELEQAIRTEFAEEYVE